MRFKKLAMILATSLLVTSLAACGGNGGSSSGDSGSGDSGSDSSAAETETTEGTDGGSEQAQVPSDDGDYDLYIFNGKGEIADALQAAVDAYSASTGKKVKLFTLGSGTDSTELLRAELNSDHMPGIFTVQNAQTLLEFVEGGYAMDLSKATNEDFIGLAQGIPESFRLTRDGQTSYGIPYNIEGYGYIVDTRMLEALFGADQVDAFIEAYKTATYAEFEAMILAMDEYIKNGSASDVVLSGKSFAFQEKSGLAENLKGVFSVAGAEKWTYGDHMINIAIDAVFENSLAAANATREQLEAGKGAFEAYAKLLDLKTSHATTARGPELISSTINGYDQSIATFANGEAIFIKQGNWCYIQLCDANPEIADTMTFLPIKLDLEQSDITANGLTVDHLNSSIPVFVSMYYVINEKVSDSERAAAEEFLAWLNTTEEGMKYIVEEMSFIPYNADPAKTSSGYCLGDCILSYVQDGQTIPDAYAGCPSGWATNVFGLQMLENYVNNAEWPESAYTDIADFVVSSWCESGGIE